VKEVIQTEEECIDCHRPSLSHRSFVFLRINNRRFSIWQPRSTRSWDIEN